MTRTSLRALSLCAALACGAALCFAQSPQTTQPQSAAAPQDEALRQELLRMLDADQAARVRIIEEKWQGESLGREMTALDAANTKRLLEISKEHGFPSVSLVGRDGVQAAVTMVSHSPSLALQQQALAYLKKALRRGEVPPEAVANLTDIILHDQQHKPQLYGTRFEIVGGKLVLGQVKDPSHLQARRAKLGLMPLSEYIKLLEGLYKMPVDTTSIPR